MKFAIFLEKPAEADIDSTYQWYANIRPQLGDEFLAFLEAAFERVIDFPKAYPIVGERLRRILLPKFSYGIYYMIDGNIIRVFAVIHTDRDPAIWKEREH